MDLPLAPVFTRLETKPPRAAFATVVPRPGPEDGLGIERRRLRLARCSISIVVHISMRDGSRDNE